MLIPNAPDKPQTQIKFVKNDKWKTVVMMVFLTLDNECINNGNQSIDRTTLYSFESDYKVYTSGPNECEPITSTGSGSDYEFKNGSIQGAVSFSATQYDISLGSYIVQGIPDINGNPPRFLRDLTIGSDGQFTNVSITMTQNSDV